MRLQLHQAPATSGEGEMFLTLTLQRSAELQHKLLVDNPMRLYWPEHP